MSTVMSNHRCGSCGRRLRYATRIVVDRDTGQERKVRYGRWVASKFTGARYCYPGEGCNR